MTDGSSSASVVIVDPEITARERDAAARALLADEPLNAPQQYIAKGIALTIPYTLKVVVASSELDHAKTFANELLSSAWNLADTVLNNFNPNSEVSLIARLPVGQMHQMSAPLKRVMACCQRVFNTSAGAFDPAVGYLLDLIYDAINTGQRIPSEKLAAISCLSTLPSSFEIDFGTGFITRKHENARLDLGGVSKGYIVDYVIEKLNEAGFANCYFDWGGDCRAIGVNARNTSWVVGIIRPPPLDQLENPPQDPPFIRVVHLNNEALATSGDYENLIKARNNKFLSKTYDKESRWLLRPSHHSLAQVTVKCYSAMYADALATASLVKRDPVAVRNMLDSWRYVRDGVTDYTAYTRDNERVARMYEIATEDADMNKKRIAGSLPARVIVIGAGLAGQSAAIEAANCGAQVFLIEKEKKLGGNSAKATSGINAWGTRAQAKQGIPDSGKYFERDTFKSGIGGNCDAGLVKTLSVKSGDAIRFLTNLGIPLSVLSQLGGHSQKRTHRAPDMADGTPVPIGYTIMQTLEKHIRTRLADRVTIMEGVAVTALLHEKELRADGTQGVRVRGVELRGGDDEVTELLADSVILATGGFSNDRTDKSLLKEYASRLLAFPTTNGSWATGDGVKLAREVGATLVDMDKVQLHPTGLINPKDPANRTKYLGPEALRGSGGILLNKKGERFVNELDLRSVVSKAIIEQRDEYPSSNGSAYAYCVLNEEARKLFGVNSHGFYWKRLGLFVKADTPEDLAKLIECSPEALRQTLEEYESLSKGKSPCPKTKKNVYPCVLGPQGPFYVAFVTPSIHYTMGGCLISPSAEVQAKGSGSAFSLRRPIQALFGAGEVTGGVHGQNRLGGNSLLECVVFGRIAGDRAATILQKSKYALSFSEWSTVVLREIREGGIYGTGCRILRFNLPGALQRSGLSLGQFVAIRGEWDGQQLLGYYSPITLPDDVGVIGILARSDKGTLKEWISALQPGDAVEMKSCGGLVIERCFQQHQLQFNGHVVRKLCLIAGGTGVAPMLQLIRAALKKPFYDGIDSIHLIYAAEDVTELTYREVLDQHERESKGKFNCTFVLNHPPSMWTDGVGFIDRSVLHTSVQAPSEGLLVVICGPPVMQRFVMSDLKKLGHNMDLVRTVDDAERQAVSKI